MRAQTGYHNTEVPPGLQKGTTWSFTNQAQRVTKRPTVPQNITAQSCRPAAPPTRPRSPHTGRAAPSGARRAAHTRPRSAARPPAAAPLPLSCVSSRRASRSNSSLLIFCLNQSFRLAQYLRETESSAAVVATAAAPQARPRRGAVPRDAHCFTFSPSASLRLFLAASSSLTYVAIAAELRGTEAAKRRKARRCVTSGEGRRPRAGAEATPPLRAERSRAESNGAERC